MNAVADRAARARSRLALRRVPGGLASGRRTFLVVLLFGEFCGSVWGLVRGLDYPPTAWAAPIEGALLALPFAVALASLVLVAQRLWHFGRCG